MRFLMTLRGANLAPAVDASRGLTHADQPLAPQPITTPAPKTP